MENFISDKEIWSRYLKSINEEIPKVGDLSVTTDFSGNAKCIIRTSLVRVIPFNEVSKEFAFKEGEGDKSLE